MKRLIKQVTVLLAGALFLAACGGGQEPAKDPAAEGGKSIAEGEVCPTSDPGPPPVCPEGCTWNGAECRASRPIVVYDKPLLPGPTATAPTAPAPTQPAPSSP